MANPSVQTVSNAADKAKVYGALLLAVAAIAGFYWLEKRGALIQWSILVAGLVAAVVIYLLSESGKEFIGLVRDSWRELKKVVWPTRPEAIQMTLYVFGFVVVMALFLWVTDKTLEWLIYDLLLGWRK